MPKDSASESRSHSPYRLPSSGRRGHVAALDVRTRAARPSSSLQIRHPSQLHPSSAQWPVHNRTHLQASTSRPTVQPLVYSSYSSLGNALGNEWLGASPISTPLSPSRWNSRRLENPDEPVGASSAIIWSRLSTPSPALVLNTVHPQFQQADNRGLMTFGSAVEQQTQRHPQQIPPPLQAFQLGPAPQSQVPVPLPQLQTQSAAHEPTFFNGAHDFHWQGDFRVDARQSYITYQCDQQGPALQQLQYSIANAAERARLDSLPKHPDMSGNRHEYLPGSRESDVEAVCEAESTSGKAVLCIHGPAGIGKSTLAGHLSDNYRSAGRLAASIFLGAFSTETSGPETIVKMIAHEIGNFHSRAIPKIIEAMDRCHGSLLEQHLEKYILEPLESLNHPQTLIIIIDALDEWRDHLTFIKSLTCLSPKYRGVRWILTGRLNPSASQMPGIDSASIHAYALGPISNEAIKAYFKKYLKTVPWVEGRRAHSGDINKLVELCEGLPVWAATVIALLSHRFSESPPHEILAEIVGSRRKVGGGDLLGTLYMSALRRLFTTLEAIVPFKRYFGAIIALEASLSILDFSQLTGLPSHLVYRIQASLQALQTRSPPPGSEHTVHPATALFHLSLIEHVLAGGAGNPFTISASESHSVLALNCMKQLRSLPHTNSQLRAIQEYSVKYWVYHAANGTPRSKSEWSETEHCKILQALSVDIQQQWARLFHKATMPGDDELKLQPNDSMVSILKKSAARLEGRGGDQWALEVACLEVAVRIDAEDPDAWTRLGWCYRRRGESVGGLQMYEEALVAYRHALRLRPESDPKHAESLDNVSIALCRCYELNGNRNILDEAISISRQAVEICLASDPDRASYLNALANVLFEQYKLDNDLQTLQEVISLRREALDLHPPPHPERATSLNNLALALDSLHKRNTKDIGPMNEAISLYREALPLRPAPHPLRYMSLGNLANSLYTLYKCNSDEKVLDEAISLQHEALALVPAPHPDRSMALNNLGMSLEARYERNHDVGMLKECLSLYREALGLVPAPHPDRPASLDNLANALLLQFEHDKKVEVLDEAISVRRELRTLCLPGHRFREADLEGFLHLLERRREFTGENRDDAEIEDVKVELAGIEQKKQEQREQKKRQRREEKEKRKQDEDEEKRKQNKDKEKRKQDEDE